MLTSILGHNFVAVLLLIMINYREKVVAQDRTMLSQPKNSPQQSNVATHQNRNNRIKPTTVRSSASPSDESLLRTGPLFFNNQPATSLTQPPIVLVEKTFKSLTTPSPVPASNVRYEWETLLVRKLFNKRHYNPQVRPAVSDESPLDVSVEFVLLQINEMVEKDQEIVVSGFVKIKWRDARLTWNSEEFGNIDWIVTESANCWLPDLALINSNDVYAVTRDMRFPLTINSSGDILYVPAGKIYARCELNLRFFPFDFQLCKYRFESWAYAAELVRITGHNFTIEPEHYMQNPEWTVPYAFVRTEIVHYETYNFSRVDFFMVLKRKSLFFITYTIFPCLALSVLQLMSHMLPFTEPERINFATTTLIAFSVFHVSIVEQMPHSSDSIPLLAIFVDSLMILIGMSLVECFLMMNWLSRVGLTVPSPRMWYYLVDRWGDYLWLGSAGNYWRRNYLYVFERLNHKLDMERRRRELERQRWASAGYRYKMSRRMHAFTTKDDANFEALLYLVQKGDRRREGAVLPPAINFSPAPQSDDQHSSNNSSQNKTPQNNATTVINFNCENGDSKNQHLLSPATEQQPLISLPHNNTNHVPLNYDSTAGIKEQLTTGSSTESLQLIYHNKHNKHRRNNKPPPPPGDPTSIGMVDLGGNKIRSGQTSPMSSCQKRQNHQHSLSAVHRRQIYKTVGNSYSSNETPGKINRHHHRVHVNKATETALLAGFGSEFQIASSGNSISNNNNNNNKGNDVPINSEPGPASLTSPVVEGRRLNIGESTGLLDFNSKQNRNYRYTQQSSVRLAKNRHENNSSAPPLNNRQQRLLTVPDSPQLTERSVSCCFSQVTALGDKIINDDQSAVNKKHAACRTDEVRNFIEEISTHVTNHELRKECTGIWITYITVVDRILSIFLCLLSFSLLVYLFYWFPAPPDLTNFNGINVKERAKN